MNFSRSGLIVSIISSLLFVVPLHGYSQKPKDTLTVLFVGNSYTYSNNLPQIVSILSESTNTFLSTRQSTAPGATLSHHWHGKKELKTRSLITNGGFDVVVLQDHSMAAIDNPDSLLKYVSLFTDLVRSKGARIILYQTWARNIQPELQETINKQYNRAAGKVKAEVIPAGEAWALMRKYNPEINLYSPDGSHPNVQGSFLNAYLFANALCRQQPQLIKNEFSTRDIQGEFIQLLYIEKEYFHIVEKISSLIN